MCQAQHKEILQKYKTNLNERAMNEKKGIRQCVFMLSGFIKQAIVA